LVGHLDTFKLSALYCLIQALYLQVKRYRAAVLSHEEVHQIQETNPGGSHPKYHKEDYMEGGQVII
jgi:hypothetical protein